MPDREDHVRNFFLEVAERNPGKSFILGGNGWDDLRLPTNVKYISHVLSRDHNTFNSSSSFVLDIGNQNTDDYGFSPGTRIFEAAGAAACIITDHWNGIGEFFVPGKEILVAKDGAEVDYFLNNVGQDEATEIGKAALQRVLSDHTFEKRALLLDKILTEQEVIYQH